MSGFFSSLLGGAPATVQGGLSAILGVDVGLEGFGSKATGATNKFFAGANN